MSSTRELLSVASCDMVACLLQANAIFRWSALVSSQPGLFSLGLCSRPTGFLLIASGGERRPAGLGGSLYTSSVGRMISDADPSTVASDGQDATKTVRLVIKGKVQGVFYRNWTVATGSELGLDGWVRNLRDGSVETVFSGKAKAVDTLVGKCYIGPSAAKVSSVEVSAWNGDVPQGFVKKPSVW